MGRSKHTMTNSEKYLKDGVDVWQLANEIKKYSENTIQLMPFNIEAFFKQEAKITLTEDERVILRNIQKGLFREGFISRTAGNELFVFIKETGETIELYIFNHLFQFIKERRRI